MHITNMSYSFLIHHIDHNLNNLNQERAGYRECAQGMTPKMQTIFI